MMKIKNFRVKSNANEKEVNRYPHTRNFDAMPSFTRSTSCYSMISHVRAIRCFSVVVWII